MRRVTALRREYARTHLDGLDIFGKRGDRHQDGSLVFAPLRGDFLRLKQLVGAEINPADSRSGSAGNAALPGFKSLYTGRVDDRMENFIEP